MPNIYRHFGFRPECYVGFLCLMMAELLGGLLLTDSDRRWEGCEREFTTFQPRLLYEIVAQRGKGGRAKVGKSACSWHSPNIFGLFPYTQTVAYIVYLYMNTLHRSLKYCVPIFLHIELVFYTNFLSFHIFVIIGWQVEKLRVCLGCLLCI